MRRLSPALGLVCVLLLALTLVAATQQAAKKPAAKPAAQKPPDTGEMVPVPAGPGKYGCVPPDGNCDTDESCQDDLPDPQEKARFRHCTVILSAFEIDKTEVTQKAFQACAKAGKCTAPAANFDPATKADHPVTDVTWEQAAAYCKWAGKRLPTEAEWERAARGTEGLRFPWGNDPPTCEQANFKGCAPRGTHPVGSHTAGASPYGALDMAGNVYEWVNDWCCGGYGGRGPYTDPQGSSQVLGDSKGRRGGSFDVEAVYARASNRGSTFYKNTKPDLGFRCAK